MCATTGRFGSDVAAVALCGVVDVQMRNLEFPELLHPPYTPGYACSGVIDELGAESLNFKKGDEVLALIPLDSKLGGCAEFTVQPVLNICPSRNSAAQTTQRSPLYPTRMTDSTRDLPHVSRVHSLCQIRPSPLSQLL